MNKKIYFDNNSTSPVDAAVLQEMLPYFSEKFGNPASQHSWGWTAEEAVTVSRQKIANLLNCDSKEIYFTSSSTESNNMAIKGVFDEATDKSHFICSPIDHSSILAHAAYLQSKNIQVDFVQNNKSGQVDVEHLKKIIRPSTKLISLTWVNSILGSINPVPEILSVAKEKKIYLHIDATQAIGKIKIDLQKTPVDILTFCAHKIHGPKGIAAIYIRSKNPRVELTPLLHGGPHEKGMRASTLNVPGIVGFGKACELIHQHFDQDQAHFQSLYQKMHQLLKQNFSIEVLGPAQERGPNNLCVLFKDVEIPVQLPFLAFSRGSACQSQDLWSPNPMLIALGLSPQEAKNTIRFTFGRQNTLAEVEQACEYLQKSLIRNKIEV